MKAFKDFMEALTLQQRRKRSIISKKKAKVTAIKRKRSMRKPPSQDKIDKAVNKAVRQKAITIVDKAGKYKDPEASIGLKTNIEKKADLKVQKMGGKWRKRLKPIIKKKIKNPYLVDQHLLESENA